MHLLRRFSLGVNNLQLSYSKSMVYLQEISWTSREGFPPSDKLHSPEVSQSTCWQVHPHVHESTSITSADQLFTPTGKHSGFFCRCSPKKSDLN